MPEHTFSICNPWLSRSFTVDDQHVFGTVSLKNEKTGYEYLKSGKEEFIFIGYVDKSISVFKASDFQYASHEISSSSDVETLKVQLTSLTGTMKLELIYEAYRHYPAIRKKMHIYNHFASPMLIQHLAWENLELAASAERRVHHYFFTQTSAAVSDYMDDSVVAVEWPNANEGLLVATEAPGAMKRMELFVKDDEIKLGYNDKEETIFEWQLNPGEMFESDASFFIPFNNMKWEDAVDGQLRNFVEEKLSICRPEQIPAFTINTWETFSLDINEAIILENIEIASELGIEAYQIDCGWSVNLGHFEPDPVKFPHGLERIVEKCEQAGIRLGLWMSVPLVHVDSPVANEHPEWFLLDENNNCGFMTGWQNAGIMCLDSDYKYWIMNEIDRTVKKYGVKLLKLDLASIRDPYNPNKSVGCHAHGHHHQTHKASHLGIYRSMFWIMDELRKRNPDCLIDLSFELYGVLHNMDLALIQHAHQNWFVNEDTAWLDNLRRLIHTRSRIVPSYTLNFGSCHLTEQLSQTYGFWSALTSHGLYYGDLRKLSASAREHYTKWINWVKAYRGKVDFLAYHKVSTTFPVPDAPDHVDRRFHPYSIYEAGRVIAKAKKWDGVAKLNHQGEGLVIVFRPEYAMEQTQTFPLPWMLEDNEYLVHDVLNHTTLGSFFGRDLRAGLELHIEERPGVLVLQLEYANR